MKTIRFVIGDKIIDRVTWETTYEVTVAPAKDDSTQLKFVVNCQSRDFRLHVARRIKF